MPCCSCDFPACSQGPDDFLRARQVELVSSGLGLGEPPRGLRLYCRASAFPAAAVHHCCWCRTSAWPAHCPSCTSQWTLALVPRAFWTQTDLGVNKNPSVAVCGFLMADLPPCPQHASALLWDLSPFPLSGAAEPSAGALTNLG